MTFVYVLLKLEGGDPVGRRRPGAPGKRYKSMGEAKMGIHSARKCKLCGLKGHIARSNKCTVRKQMKVQNKDNESSCTVNVDEKNIKKKRNRLGKLRSSSAPSPSTLSNALQSEDESVAAESGEESSSADGEFYNVEAVVNGPNKRGEYEVNWEGCDSSTNTWEKESGLPKSLLKEYTTRRTRKSSSSSSDDDEPIVKKINRGVYTA